MPQPFFTMHNKHVPACGTPPAVSNDEASCYFGYFENAHGEQWIFVCDRRTKRGQLRGGDVGWDTAHAVRPRWCGTSRRLAETTSRSGWPARSPRGVAVIRIHASGDFFAEGYVRQWAAIAAAAPAVTFYAYTRSWRVPGIREALEEFAALPNVRLWYSADRDTGLPEHVPAGVRVAWLETLAEEDVPPTWPGRRGGSRSSRRRHHERGSSSSRRSARPRDRPGPTTSARRSTPAASP